MHELSCFVMWLLESSPQMLILHTQEEKSIQNIFGKYKSYYEIIKVKLGKLSGKMGWNCLFDFLMDIQIFNYERFIADIPIIENLTLENGRNIFVGF